MNDPNAIIRKWLATGLSTERVSVAVLPAWDAEKETGFRPQDGPWIVVSVAGGGVHSEAPIFMGVIQITVFAGPDEGEAAGTLSTQIRNLIHGQNHVDLSPDGYVLACNENTDNLAGAEPDASYATSTSMYDVILR